MRTMTVVGNGNGVVVEETINVVDDRGQPGRPTKYNEETLNRLYSALANGMPIKGACAVAGIGVSTLNDWRKDSPELEQRLAESRERFRETALLEIKKAFESGDWRAAAKALELVYPEYRAGVNKVEVSATTNNNFLVLSVEKQREFQERHRIALQE